MSTPGSSPSNPGSSPGHSPALVSPSKKVQALLAQFSDSESEAEQPKARLKAASNLEKLTESSDSTGESDEHDETQPQGRLVARLLGERKTADTSVTSISRSLSPVKSAVNLGNAVSSAESSDDEVVTTGPMRRRLLTRRKSSSIHQDGTSQTSQRAASPPVSPSPSPVSRKNNGGSPSNTSNTSRSKFLAALVEKHRRERLEKEAAETTKRAMGNADTASGTERKLRGSSPADDSGEGGSSDDGEAVKRLQKQSRPTRKASKKALEDMNRETQRMSRSMQLAHQAQTKKKVTKESLFARFNYLQVVAPSTIQPPNAGQTSASNSTITSDSENDNGHSTTPPTSPLKESGDLQQKREGPSVEEVTRGLPEMHGALTESAKISSFEDASNSEMSAPGMQKLLDFQTNDRTVISPKSRNRNALVQNPSDKTIPSQTVDHSVRVMSVLQRAITHKADSDSDGEIEIVKERGQKRKFAAFETLPRRKAKETPSHLALRSLAHLMHQDEKKRSINAAELESALRRKARLQAMQERQQRIEQARAKGIIVQSAEERERDLQEVEDLVERARQEAVEIQRREKELAKKEGTYVKDNLDDEDDEDSDDADFEEEPEDSQGSESEDDEHEVENDGRQDGLVDDEANETESDGAAENDESEHDALSEVDLLVVDDPSSRQRSLRKPRIVSDDEDENEEGVIGASRKSPQLPFIAKTPVSVPRSARKLIPGLQMSDDLPMGLSQAFAATMAGSQTQDASQTQRQDSQDYLADLPTPHVPIPPLHRLESLDLISESQPLASQTQPLDLNLFSQSQIVPESPHRPDATATQYTPSQKQVPFDLTQDGGYILSPFAGNRFAKTPTFAAPGSTIDTVIVANDVEDSPIVQRRGRLQRRKDIVESDAADDVPRVTAFQIMQQATKQKNVQADFDKKKSNARNIVDEAAEESEDEYAGLGGASDDSGDDEENDDDRRMIDEDTQIGKGDEAKLAGLYADRERERDEQQVSKLLKDITTGALRRKRGVGDDLDLSDEEDAVARRREAKRREFARMRRELLKDEAVGKIAEDKRKEAFLRSIEDREVIEDDDDGDEDEPVQHETSADSQSQGQEHLVEVVTGNAQQAAHGRPPGVKPLDPASACVLNRAPAASRRTNSQYNRKPATLAEIRETVSFLVEEPESQAAMVDLGLSDSEEGPEAYVDLDRHFREAEADENALEEDEDDLGGFVVDDVSEGPTDTEGGVFKKPDLPRQERAPFSERRTKHANVVDRLSLLRQASSSASAASSTSIPTKMAFLSSKTDGSFSGVPSLLRRATTNSSLGSMSGRENVSATGVVTNKTERGRAAEEKEFVRKGSGGRRNAVNYQTERKTLREEKMSARAGVKKGAKARKGSGFLGGLFRGDSWE